MTAGTAGTIKSPASTIKDTMQPLLIIDTNYLCYRAFYSVGNLTYEGEATGVLYGVMVTIKELADLFQTDQALFCFDGANNKRYARYPEYKANRKRDESYDMFKAQVHKLPETLRAAGFSNVLQVDGYEADDIMAKVAADLPDEQTGILVTEDQDLYQCLRENVWMYKPRKAKAYNAKSFAKEYGLPISEWPLVKAIAGCSSDNIKGVPGVGEKTAIKFLLGQLKQTTKAYSNIMAFQGHGKMHDNLGLVTLPIDDDLEVEVSQQGVTIDQWNYLADNLGMGTLRKGKKRDKEEGFGIGG